MNSFIVFYLMISAVHSVPLVVITLSLQYDQSSFFSPKMFNDRIVQQLRRNGITRFEQFCKALNSEANESLARFSLISLLFQLLTMLLMILAEIFHVPMPFLSKINDSLTTENIVKFSMIIACLQLIPLIIFALALFIEVRLPYLSRQNEIHEPPRDEITHGNESRQEVITIRQNEIHEPPRDETAQGNESPQEIITIRVTEWENSGKTFIFANCRDNQLGELFEIVVCQREPGAKPECFLYTNNENLEPIGRARVDVHQPNQIFASDENETAT